LDAPPFLLELGDYLFSAAFMKKSLSLMPPPPSQTCCPKISDPVALILSLCGEVWSFPPYVLPAIERFFLLDSPLQDFPQTKVFARFTQRVHALSVERHPLGSPRSELFDCPCFVPTPLSIFRGLGWNLVVVLITGFPFPLASSLLGLMLVSFYNLVPTASCLGFF